MSWISPSGGHPAYADARKVGAVFGYGSFLTAAINFLIIAFALYLLIRAMNKLMARTAEAPAPPPPTREEVLLAEIRDLLARKAYENKKA